MSSEYTAGRTVSRRTLLAGTAAGAAVLAGVGTQTALADEGTELWSAEVGLGAGSPAVGDGRVFVSGQDEFIAFDADSGEVEWTRSGATSTPTVADGTLYVGQDGDLLALDLDGEELWVSEWEGPASPGVSSRPIPAGDLVYFTGGQRLHAADRETGEVLWWFNNEAFQRGESWADPAVVDDVVIAGHDAGELHALDTETGEERWTYDGGNNSFSRVVSAGGLVYVGTREGEVLGLADGATVEWEYDIDGGPSLRESDPSLDDDIFYIGATNGALYALDTTETDDDAIEQWLFNTGDSIQTGPVLTEERVYVGNSDGDVYAVDRSDGEEVWHFQTGGRISSTPTIDGSTLYVTSYDEHIYAIDLGDDSVDDGADDGLPGFGAVAGLLGVGGLGYLLARRATDR